LTRKALAAACNLPSLLFAAAEAVEAAVDVALAVGVVLVGVAALAVRDAAAAARAGDGAAGAEPRSEIVDDRSGSLAAASADVLPSYESTIAL
jgi:hypothetical protein